MKCESCLAAVSAVDGNGDGLTCGCWKNNPLERAGAALFDDFKHSIGWPSKTWADPALDDTDGRETFRRKADAALRAAIDQAELVRILQETLLDMPPERARLIARTVTTHYLGSDAPSTRPNSGTLRPTE